ncbi:MAG: glutamate-5-semialdehyde dehydrogenase [Firmicutes bacterium]|nr:glutamate-5-semialdehyde dehydrogenase [Bacillota bacterium]
MISIEEQVRRQAKAAQAAARKMALLSSEQKNAALEAMAQALERNSPQILAANAQDLKCARAKGLSSALLDRLTLSEQRVLDMVEGLRAVAGLPDPVGEVVRAWRVPSGLEVGRVRVPLGVVGIIYEARPNVTVDAAALCLKAGNAVILKGGSEAIDSNKAIARALIQGAEGTDVPPEAVQLIESTDRRAVATMMEQRGLIDVLIPRGGAGLIRTVMENSTIPVIETGVGNCHVYVDVHGDLEMARRIAINAKCQRPGVCNAMETLLVHREVAEELLPALAAQLMERGVQLRGCPRTLALVPGAQPAQEEDWHEEYLDLVLAVRVVDSLDEALDHIARYGSKHSEAIVTGDYHAARRFLREVDAAAVYVNASTRFTDGGQFGLGAEMGISTQKLHARGPMGLEELTTTKFIVYGEGQVR